MHCDRYIIFLIWTLTLFNETEDNGLHENAKNESVLRYNFICDFFFIQKFLSLLRVLVMGDGEVLEFDEPNLLIQNADSYFYHLASQEFSDHEWLSPPQDCITNVRDDNDDYT